MNDCKADKKARNIRPSTHSEPQMDPGEEIVISGVAGRFPESDNVRQVQENLFNKIDLVTNDTRRWIINDPEIPARTGKINNISKFDALFFGVHFKQAQAMDPMCRMLMEHAYEAIIDAGINPRQLRGTKTGVFIGATFSESEKTWLYEVPQINGFGLTGTSRAMFANRISYCLGLTGPSYSVDSACSSTLHAMEHAYRAIRNGKCDAALVGGANLCLHPYVSLQYSQLGVLSTDGRCKTFDADASGYARSEAASIVFLQKAKNSKRIYATVVHGKTICDGFNEEGITFPSTIVQSNFLKEFYEECKISPLNVSYVEAHGTGSKVGDPAEINAIDSVFCTGRSAPLKIGSIKSNMGHTEPASGICGIIKLVIANETGLIPPNLHYKRPPEGIKSLEEGRIQVVTEPTPWDGGYMGINAFGFGGANAHILLKSNPKDKINNGAPQDDLPRLIMVSGRTEEAVDTLLNDIESRPLDVEYIRLLHDIHAEEIAGHLYRGYTVINETAVTKEHIREIEYYSGAKRPIWFVFSGMGSHWPGMGTALLRLPIFAEAIKKCDVVLKPRGVDIYDVLTNQNKSIFDTILNSFVGIAAVQIGLVDLLNSLGIIPDGIIGHSVGELGCAYADGCFTAEQMILASYSRGLAAIETHTIAGSMAAVGLGYEDIKDLCPPDIEVACHNGPDSSTISGPVKSMQDFVAKLQANKIFAREVQVSNIAFHSRYIAKAGPKLLAYLREVIPQPKARSSKWLSTSVPRSKWSMPEARFSSAEYHTNNLLSSVLFEETSLLIPKDAVTIEIAPHGLLQAILRQSLNPDVTNVALTQRGHKDNVVVFLQAIGKLYDIGLQPQISILYPPVQFPVSRGTPMISPLVKWDHSADWYVTTYKMQAKTISGERVIAVSLDNEGYEYMTGHVIDGRILLPAAGYLVLVWETIGIMREQTYTEFSVVFEDVKFLRVTVLPKEGIVELTLMIQKGSGRFEIVDGDTAVVTGNIHYTPKASLEKINLLLPEDDFIEELLNDDVYKQFKVRGYHYNKLFRGIKCATADGSRGKINWSNNWVVFIDNMLQMLILETDSRELFLPKAIQKLVIDTETHLNLIHTMPDNARDFPVYRHKMYDSIVAGGVEICGIKVSAINRRKAPGNLVLESYRFVAHRDRAETSLQEAVRLVTHIALENHLGMEVKTLEILKAGEKCPVNELLSSLVLASMRSIPLIQPDVNIIDVEGTYEDGDLPENIKSIEVTKLTADTNALLLIGRHLLTKRMSSYMAQFLLALKNGGFILTVETEKINNLIMSAKIHGLDIIFEKVVNKATLLLLRKHVKLPEDLLIVKVINDKFTWIDELKNILNRKIEQKSRDSARVLLVSDKNFENGLMGLINCLRKEAGGEMIRGILIQDKKASSFSLSNPFYANQLNLDLVINVLRPNSTWGSYRYLQLEPPKPRPVHHAMANQLVRGDLSSLKWLEGPIQRGLNHPDLIRVVYSSLNSRDIMLATGKLAVDTAFDTRASKECGLGFEYSGVDRDGRRVMGLLCSQSLVNQTIIDRSISWYVPDSWTLEDAATVPFAYAVAYQALYIIAGMTKADKVLIHRGSDDVGQAAIILALNERCEVFTTVETDEKRKFIRTKFPQIPNDHIASSTNTHFERMILTQTTGVNIVLNSLAGEKFRASLRCLATGGKFLEIGKFQINNDSTLGMATFKKELSVHAILIDNIFAMSDMRKSKLKTILQKGLDDGSVKPLTRTVFPKHEMVAAFQFMAAEKHIGKVMINILDEINLQDTAIVALPRYHCLPDRSYIILGGLEGFGLELADWLVQRGARNLILISRTGYSNGYQRMRVKTWQNHGARVVIIIGKDAANHAQCKEILKTAAQLAPVDAIFNVAVVLKDNLLKNQTTDTFVESFKAKAWSTKTLDEVSRKICPNLRHFVVFSSVACGRGNSGQTNNGMSNSIMERICERRAAEGLPALAIQWGAVGEIGLEELIIGGGILPQMISSCLQQLNGFLTQDAPIVTSFVIAEKDADGAGSLNVVDTVLNIMNIKDLKAISHHLSLAELGMDLMMAVELQQIMERDYDVFLNAQEIRRLNFAKLLEINSKQMEQKRRDMKSNGDAKELTGTEQLIRLMGVENIQSDIYMKLQTHEMDERHEVFLIPGIEGCATVFSNLARNLKSPATCLQLDNTKTEYMTIEDMAKEMLPHVLLRNKGRRDFVIAGYSYGSLVAIELASKLEAEGLTGKLILIDGAPQLMRAIKHHRFASSNNAELETIILTNFIDTLIDTDSELLLELRKAKSWKEKLNMFMTRLPAEALPIFSGRNICRAMYNRLIALQNYDEFKHPPLRSPIVLLKPSIPTIMTVSGDFGLSALTRAKVDVHVIYGNHLTILDDEKIVTAIDGEPLEDAAAFKARIMADSNVPENGIPYRF